MSRYRFPDGPTAYTGDPVVVPPLPCPFPLRVNPGLAELEVHSVRRGRQLYRSTDDPAYQRHRSRAYAELAACLYPTAGPRELAVAHDVVVLLGCADDPFRHTSLSADRELMSLRVNQLRGGPADAAAGATAELTAEVWRELSSVASRSWRTRFTAHLGDWAGSVLREADHSRDSTTPSEESYKEGRRNTVAVDVLLDLVDLAEHIALPDQVTGSRIHRAYRQAVAESMIAVADLGRLRRSPARADPHNLVLVVQDVYGITLWEAVDYVRTHLTSQLRRVREHGRMALDFFPRHSDFLRRGHDATGSLLSGWFHWHASDRVADSRPGRPGLRSAPREDRTHPHTRAVPSTSEEE